MKILLGEKNATVNEVIEEIADDQADSVCFGNLKKKFFSFKSLLFSFKGFRSGGKTE